MNSKLDDILRKIKRLEDELLAETQTKEKQFRYEIKKRKVRFAEEATAQHKKLVKKIWRYLHCLA